MARPTDSEINAIEESVFHLQISRKGDLPYYRPHRVSQEAEGTRGKCGQDLYGGFCGKEWIKQRKQIDYF